MQTRKFNEIAIFNGLIACPLYLFR